MAQLWSFCAPPRLIGSPQSAVNSAFKKWSHWTDAAVRRSSGSVLRLRVRIEGRNVTFTQDRTILEELIFSAVRRQTTDVLYSWRGQSRQCLTEKINIRKVMPVLSKWRTEIQGLPRVSEGQSLRGGEGGWGESGEAGVEWRKGQHFNMNSWEVVVLDVVQSSGPIANSERRRGDNPTCWWSNRGLHTCFQSCIFLERSVGRRALLPYTCQQSSHLSALNNGVVGMSEIIPNLISEVLKFEVPFLYFCTSHMIYRHFYLFNMNMKILTIWQLVWGFPPRCRRVWPESSPTRCEAAAPPGSLASWGCHLTNPLFSSSCSEPGGTRGSQWWLWMIFF